MKTKKMLIPIDIKNPEKNINDFLFPDIVENKFVLKGIKSGKIWDNGIVTYVGKEITMNDIFARIIDSGKKIDSVDVLA